MGDEGVHFVATYIAPLKKIKMLKLANCNITDDGFAILCKTLLNLKVEKIFINNNKISGKSLKNLFVFLDGNTQIKLINIKNNLIGKNDKLRVIKKIVLKKVTVLL